MPTNATNRREQLRRQQEAAAKQRRTTRIVGVIAGVLALVLIGVFAAVSVATACTLAGSPAAGIAAIHQETVMFDDLTVAENICAGHWPLHARGWRKGLIDWNHSGSIVMPATSVTVRDCANSAILPAACSTIIQNSMAPSHNGT